MKLHLGCGEKYLPGYYHVDIQKYAHVDLVADISNLPSIESGSVDLIYACHVLEHFGRYDYTAALREWARLLRMGGVLQLSVPDFRAIAEWYLNDARSGGIDDVIGLCSGGQRDEYDVHKMIFDEESLTRTLLDVGFSTVRTWDWRRTDHVDVDDYSQAYLPHMDKRQGRLMSLNLEAVR
jgi:predicted SAM-dependent methyltransferase